MSTTNQTQTQKTQAVRKPHLKVQVAPQPGPEPTTTSPQQRPIQMNVRDPTPSLVMDISQRLGELYIKTHDIFVEQQLIAEALFPDRSRLSVEQLNRLDTLLADLEQKLKQLELRLTARAINLV